MRPAVDGGGGGGGVPGSSGVTSGDGAEVGLTPATFVAVTVNVYGVPFVNPGTVHDSSPAVEQVAPSGDDVTV